MTKIIISLTLTAAVLLGMAYGALVILGRLAELVDTNDWVAGGVGAIMQRGGMFRFILGVNNIGQQP